MRALLGFLLSIFLAASATASPSTADHTKFKALQQPFESGPQVTKACLSCHTEAAKQIHKTKHWTWEFLNPENRQRQGKRNVLNNFCISPVSNYAYCTACHIGYGWKDDRFDFASEENVDCLVCHDTTATYKKRRGLAGHPFYKPTEYPPGSGNVYAPVDLQEIAQNVGKTSRESCGACHFHGGGEDGAKHGDMDSSLTNPESGLDVHMNATGSNFTCATCHMTKSHAIPGSRYAPTAKDTAGARMRGKPDASNPGTCEACHGSGPHKAGTNAKRLNRHSDKLACQACHIPEYARGGIATKMSWDWSTAGRLRDGKPYIEKDDGDRIRYDSKKGSFTHAERVVPEYMWFNGEVAHTLLDEKVAKTDGTVRLNRYGGSPVDGKSRIWPIKVFRGKQPYDPENQTLLTLHVTGDDRTAYWKNFDWKAAVGAAMAAAGKPFSGKVEFVDSEMRWPITHMVAPKEDALACAQCHARAGRLKDIRGVYLPGRDRAPLLDTLGFALAGLALASVLIHGGLRIANRRRKV